MDSYFTPYPTHIEIPADYWVSSHDVECTVEDNDR